MIPSFWLSRRIITLVEGLQMLERPQLTESEDHHDRVKDRMTLMKGRKGMEGH